MPFLATNSQHFIHISKSVSECYSCHTWTYHYTVRHRPIDDKRRNDAKVIKQINMKIHISTIIKESLATDSVYHH